MNAGTGNNSQTGPITIDAEDLIHALQGWSPELDHYLDLSTGEIVFAVDEDISGIDDGLEKLIQENSTQFVWIEPSPSSVSWQVMADFVEQLPVGDAREKLTRSLHAGKPFRCFKNALLNYQDVRQKWFAFECSNWLDIAHGWLKREGIEAKLKTRKIE